MIFLQVKSVELSKRYAFVTKWKIAAPLEEVWDAIYDSENWPGWWKSVLTVKEIEKGDNCGIGSVRVYKLRSPLYYTLSFSLLLTKREDHKILEGLASGDLEGTGAWYFSQSDGVTHVECHWHVRTTIKWMNALGFLLKPLFEFNHKLVMKQGASDLAKLLNARLIR
jgi:uncharacterized membrane protein